MRRHQALDGLDDDIREFIERETEENIARGMMPDEARRQAHLAFGNVARVREDTRAVWVPLWAEQLWQDLRYALRMIRRNPRFAAVVVLTLAVAIGMHTAIFTVFNAVVLRPIGYPHAERLVWVSTVGRDGDAGLVTGPDFVEWREQAQAFDRMVAYFTSEDTLIAAHGATRVSAAVVTEDFWDLTGAAPVDGRWPRPGERDVVLISQGLANRSFAGDAEIVGRVVTLSGRQVTIVGILPDSFRWQFPSVRTGLHAAAIDVYQSLVVLPVRSGPVPLVNVVARLDAGVTRDRAYAEVAAIRTRNAHAHPNPFDDERALRVVPLQEQVIGGAGRALAVLLGAVSFVLVIACVNAANLLLARTSTRHRELAVRRAVGAGRLRLVRQLLVETLVLAGLGSAAGLLLARAGVAAIVQMAPQAIPRLAESRIDARVLALVLATCVLTVGLAGLAPALASWRSHPQDVLKGDTRMTSPSTSRVRGRRILVAGEVALALVLLIGAGLLLKSARQMNAYPAGFEPQRILTAKIPFAGPGHADAQQGLAFADALLERLRRAPHVDAVTLTTHGSALTAVLPVEGEARPALEALARRPPIFVNGTSSALPRVLGFRMVRGRWFTDTERAVVINESLVRRDFAGRDPIGKRVTMNRNGPAFTIVGIVADLQWSKLDAPVDPEVYVPYGRLDDGLFEFSVLALTTDDPTALASTVRRVVADLDPTQVPTDVSSLEEALAASIAPRRLNLVLFGTFAVAALFLAVIGIYGVMAYAVAQRAQEIGVRLALGARRMDVVRMVVIQGMRVTLAGIVAGVAAALLLTRFMESLLVDVHPADPWTFVLVTAVLAVTGLLACCGPALRAALVDPVDTLRAE